MKNKFITAETIYIDHPQASYGIFCFNSIGDLFLNSDWGSYSFAWRAYGNNFKEFLKGTNSDYVLGKFETNYIEITGKRKLPEHRAKNVKLLIDAFITELKDTPHQQMSMFQAMKIMSDRDLDIRRGDTIVGTKKVKAGYEITLGVDEGTGQELSLQLMGQKTEKQLAAFIIVLDLDQYNKVLKGE